MPGRSMGSLPQFSYKGIIEEVKRMFNMFSLHMFIMYVIIWKKRNVGNSIDLEEV